MEKNRKRSISLKEFIEQTQERRVEIFSEIPKNFKELDKVVQKNFLDRRRQDEFLSIKKKDQDTLVAGHYLTRIKKGTYGYFLKTESLGTLILKDNKVIKNDISDKLLEELLDSNTYNLLSRLHYDIRIKIYCSKRLLKDLLTGKLYNEQTCIQAVLKNSFGVKPTEVCWKYFKKEELDKFCTDYDFFPLMNRKAITNLNMYYEVFNEHKDKRLLNDAIELAFALDLTINPKWSMKRLKQEHQRMIKITAEKQFEVLNDVPIQKETIQDEDKEINMLNDEKSIFIEGKEMMHCLFTNYLSSVQKGRYLAFAVKGKERATFGVTLNNDRKDIVIDQIRGVHNSSVTQETIQKVKDFVNRHLNTMREMLGIHSNTEGGNNRVTVNYEGECFADLPF